MNKDHLTNEVSNFREAVENYKRLLLESRDSMMPEIVRNYEQISIGRTALVRKYASLEKYLDKLGKRPRMRDGVNPEYYPVYHNAFSTDILLRVGPSLGAVEQDLDYVLGKLDSMSEEEVAGLLRSGEPVDPKIIASAGGGGGGGGGLGGGRGGDGGSVVTGVSPEKIGIEHVKIPHRQYWGKVLHDFWAWIKEHVLTTVIAGLILAFFVYLLGWNK